MRTSKPNTQRPWLTSSDVEIPTVELREISKSWDEQTWNAYLKWYESGSRELLIAQATFDRVAEEQVENIFEACGPQASSEDQRICEETLHSLAPFEAHVLKQIFFEGRTIREISAIEGLPKSTVHDLKNRGLSRLKRGISGDDSDAQQFMRGERSAIDEKEPSIWDVVCLKPIKEPRAYWPKDQRSEIKHLQFDSLKRALLELSDRERRILYLRYWCDLSYSAIARDLKCGVNTVSDIDTAAVSKVKRHVLNLEIQKLSGGVSCA